MKFVSGPTLAGLKVAGTWKIQLDEALTKVDTSGVKTLVGSSRFGGVIILCRLRGIQQLFKIKL